MDPGEIVLLPGSAKAGKGYTVNFGTKICRGRPVATGKGRRDSAAQFGMAKILVGALLLLGAGWVLFRGQQTHTTCGHTRRGKVAGWSIAICSWW